VESRKENRHSDAEWYCRKDSEEERFYEIFFQMCQKYGVRWASAEEKERQFIEEVTRVTYERERAVRLGLPLSEVRPSFAS
jgi:hypothetical protein